jgi:hypothetical protein
MIIGLLDLGCLADDDLQVDHGEVVVVVVVEAALQVVDLQEIVLFLPLSLLLLDICFVGENHPDRVFDDFSWARTVNWCRMVPVVELPSLDLYIWEVLFLMDW